MRQCKAGSAKRQVRCNAKPSSAKLYQGVSAKGGSAKAGSAKEAGAQ